MTATVFISYSRADSDFALKLAADLAAHGLNVWLDHERLMPGAADWEREIRRGIILSQGVVYVASEEAATSPYVRDELLVARENGKAVYPVWARGDKWSTCVPLGWGVTQYVDGRGSRYGEAVRELAVVLAKKICIRLIVAPDIGEGDDPDTMFPVLVPEFKWVQMASELRREGFDVALPTAALIRLHDDWYRVQMSFSPNPQPDVWVVALEAEGGGWGSCTDIENYLLDHSPPPNVPVVVFTPEDTDDELVQRVMCHLTGGLPSATRRTAPCELCKERGETLSPFSLAFNVTEWVRRNVSAKK